MKRQFFKIPSFVAIMLKKDNHVSLIKRENTGYRDGQLALPGGMMEDGESVVQAATREAQEELGVTLKPEAIDVIHVLHRKSGDGFQKIIFFVHVSNWDGELKNCEPDKHGEVNWFAFDKLPDTIVPHHKRALAAIENNIFFSEDGWE